MKTQLSYLSPENSTNFFSTIDDILCDVEFLRKGQKAAYGNVPAVFDIEASSFYNSTGDKQCCMYAWVFGLNGRCIRGRTWSEFFSVLETLCNVYKLSLKRRLIIYVHNLAYEFQWFREFLDWETVFSVEERKPVYAVTKQGIEFRCSYILSGYSLTKLGENLHKYHVLKRVGDLDYKLIRHSETPLTATEWGYILNDGLVVMAHIQEEIERLGNINKIPLTKTGYVRVMCRDNCFKGVGRFEFSSTMRSLRMSSSDYKQLKRAYTGGFTHANANYVGMTIDNVHSFDFSSSYPSTMLSEKYPMSKPFRVEIKDEADFMRKLNTYCCMFDVTFYNISSTASYENYISESRCKAEHYIVNNGRIVEADKLTMTLTEQDFFVIAELYEWDYMGIFNFKCFYKEYLPKEFIKTILKLYVNKTTLKGVDGKEVEYTVSKGMINACYGMCVTDPCRDEIIYDMSAGWGLKSCDIEKAIEKYNRNQARFLYYPWGVWITAYARRNLFSGICEFKDDYIYSDTDSIKVVNIERHKNYINNYNKAVTAKIERCLRYYNIPVTAARPKTINGVEKPLGVWDYEGMYTRFKTLGAKRYMTEKDGDINITVAGVNKSAGCKYLKYKYKTNDEIFKVFTDELYFPANYVWKKDENDENEKGVELCASGKLCHTYIDTEMSGEVIDYMGNKGNYNECSGVHLENTDYSLNIDETLKNLLKGIKGNYIV